MRCTSLDGRDLWPPKPNQFFLESKRTVVEEFSEGDHDISRSWEREGRTYWWKSVNKKNASGKSYRGGIQSELLILSLPLSPSPIHTSQRSQGQHLISPFLICLWLKWGFIFSWFSTMFHCAMLWYSPIVVLMITCWSNSSGVSLSHYSHRWNEY